jgi:hypothetical protein
MGIWLSGASSMALLWWSVWAVERAEWLPLAALAASVAAGILATLGLMASGAFTFTVEKRVKKDIDAGSLSSDEAEQLFGTLRTTDV